MCKSGFPGSVFTSPFPSLCGFLYHKSSCATGNPSCAWDVDVDGCSARWDGQGDPARSHPSSPLVFPRNFLPFHCAVTAVRRDFYSWQNRGGEHKHWDFLAGSVPRKSTRVMSERTSTAWPDPWNAQQDITARRKQGLPTSTRVQRAPTAASPAWQTPGTAGLVLGARSVPRQVGIVRGLNKILICFGSGSE